MRRSSILLRNGFARRRLYLTTPCRHHSVQEILGPSEAFENPWETTNSWIKPLTGPVDIQSRHILQRIQELYQHQRPLSLDEVTTDRCNAILSLLFSSGDRITDTERSDRAHAILQAMQLFKPLLHFLPAVLHASVTLAVGEFSSP